MGKPVFVCRRCGKCCKEDWEITLDFELDILRWIREKRFDILRHVVLNPKYILNPRHYADVPQWIINTGHVLFGDETHKCPFLLESINGNPAGCGIHEAWPQVCKRFPYDEKRRVRSDILDVCVGSIFFHSKAAEEEGLGFMEYVEKNQTKTNGNPAPRKNELKEIATSFRAIDLKVGFTSDLGLKMAEELLTKMEKPFEKETEKQHLKAQCNEAKEDENQGRRDLY